MTKPKQDQPADEDEKDRNQGPKGRLRQSMGKLAAAPCAE